MLHVPHSKGTLTFVLILNYECKSQYVGKLLSWQKSALSNCFFPSLNCSVAKTQPLIGQWPHWQITTPFKLNKQIKINYLTSLHETFLFCVSTTDINVRPLTYHIATPRSPNSHRFCDTESVQINHDHLLFVYERREVGATTHSFVVNEWKRCTEGVCDKEI